MPDTGIRSVILPSGVSFEGLVIVCGDCTALIIVCGKIALAREFLHQKEKYDSLLRSISESL